MKRLTLAFLCFTLAACAPMQPLMWVKAGATEAEFEQAKAQCVYEVTAATQQTDYGLRTVFGQELDRSIRQRDLAILCMKARGYTQKVN